jgi:peptide/nickel transport system permease protein
MGTFRSYIVPRLMQWVIVVFVGVTVSFIVPRLAPTDPVQSTLNRVSALSDVNPEAVIKLEETLRDLYGLKGSGWEQYLNFWKRLFNGNFGPSLTMFPIPVMTVLKIALPWTIGLLAVSTLLGWGIGMLLGMFSGYFSNQKWIHGLDAIIMCLYPIPYYIMALTLVLLLTYVLPIFPILGGVGIGIKAALSWTFISSVVTHGFLPALSLILAAVGWSYMSQRALVSTVITSDFVMYAKAAALPRRKILFQYILRNSLLPQITDLALSLGVIFGGALITEYVFSYPGVGQILYTAILQGDFNMMMGITVFSVVGIATAALVVDLLYPFFDPRIRYR